MGPSGPPRLSLLGDTLTRAIKNSHIEWTTHTFNPWEGCTRVSPGCLHCYAEARNARFSGGAAVNWGKGAPRRRTSVHNWNEPRRWERAYLVELAAFNEGGGKGERPERPRVFCASLADWLDEEVSPEWLADLLDLVRTTPGLDWLLLSKRPQNFKEQLAGAATAYCDKAHDALVEWIQLWYLGNQVPENVWVGTTVEDQTRANERIPLLEAIPAVTRFLSCEPMVGPVSLMDAGAIISDHMGDPSVPGGTVPLYHASKIDWVICGGESGPEARLMHPDWARSLRDECKLADIPFLFKQWGEWRPLTLDECVSRNDVGFAKRDPQDKRPTFDGCHHLAHQLTEMLTSVVHGWQCPMLKVGKVKAGRLLDGVEHNGYPFRVTHLGS